MKEVCMYCQTEIEREIQWLDIFSFNDVCSNDGLCVHCQKLFKPYYFTDKQCVACGRPLLETSTYNKAYIINGLPYCSDCYRWKQQYPQIDIHNVALLVYDALLSEWFYRYKYIGDCRLGVMMRSYLKIIYEKYREWCWVTLPSNPNTFKDRQFHPTMTLLDCAHIPYQQIFEYVGDGEKQATKGRKERMLLRQPFCMYTDIPNSMNGILVFDDVYTTGATLMCARLAILDYYQRKNDVAPPVQTLTLARDLNLKE